MSNTEMSSREDPILTRVAALPSVPVPTELSRSIRVAAQSKLRPRPLHPIWSIAVAGTTLSYLTSALYFVSRLQGLP